jgi:phenylpropionate dioxygenase-like ring-hydroxylating dioxygenase large terminal subunit
MAEGNAQFSPVPFQVTDPERIPTQRYYDEEFYRLECERLWPHVWQMACRLEQIPNVGDWIEYTNLGKSVIIVRTKAGIKAYNNACRHRGVKLAQEHHGNCETQGFTCPFHGWRWNMDGKNTFVYGKHLFSERQLEQADLALAPCRVELWGGCAWINWDDKAPALLESIGPLAARFEAHALDKLRAEWCYATVLPANWKVAMEAFMEGYHVMRTHPQLQEATPGMYNVRYGQDTGGLGHAVNPKANIRELIDAELRSMQLLSEGMAGMLHAKEVEIARGMREVALPDVDPGQQVMAWYGMVMAEISKQLKARGEPCPDLTTVAQTDPVEAVEYIFPHYFLLPFFSSMSAYRIRPLGPESCLFEIWSLTLFPEGQEPPPVMDPIVLPHDSQEFPPIPRQDYSNIPAQQIGLHAEGFEFMRLAKNIEGLISNYQRLIDGYLNGVAPEKLAKGMNELAGNFDGPIKDLGF